MESQFQDRLNFGDTKRAPPSNRAHMPTNTLEVQTENQLSPPVQRTLPPRTYAAPRPTGPEGRYTRGDLANSEAVRALLETFNGSIRAIIFPQGYY